MNRVSVLGAAARLGLGLGLVVVVGAETPSHLRTTIDEYLQAGAFAQQAVALSNFTDKPLVVLTAGTCSQPGWGAA